MSTPAIRDRFARDDLPHRLGALAANLLRVETFCRRAGSLELARRVMEESKLFIEWSARNANVETAAALVQLQRELVSRLRRWPSGGWAPTFGEETGSWAANWAERVLAMSGLTESSARSRMAGGAIPAKHKFAVMALGGVWHGIEAVTTDAGVFSRTSPIAPDEFWSVRYGENWVEAVSGAELYLTVTAESLNGDIDDELLELANRCGLLRYGLALTSRHFKCGVGFLMSGSHHDDRARVRQTGEMPKLFRHPNARADQLTTPDFLRAGQFARDLYAPFATTTHRLKLSVESFMQGMESREAVERIHCFVRASEGVIRPRKSTTQRDFVSAVQSVLTNDCSAVLDEMFRIRSADEHLRDPMAEISAPSDAEKERILLLRAAEAEAIARAFLTRVLEIPALRSRRFPGELSAEGFWSEDDRRLWGMPLDLGREVLDMTSHG